METNKTHVPLTKERLEALRKALTWDDLDTLDDLLECYKDLLTHSKKMAEVIEAWDRAEDVDANGSIQASFLETVYSSPKIPETVPDQTQIERPAL